jgi:hypothetical protein
VSRLPFRHAYVPGPSSRHPLGRLQHAGWLVADLDARGALNAFVESCRRIEDRPDAAPMSPNAPYAGTAGDWRGVCLEAAMLRPRPRPAEQARRFFERNFTPFNWSPTGRLTGYYEPYLEVETSPTPEFSMAIRARPERSVSLVIWANSSPGLTVSALLDARGQSAFRALSQPGGD